MGFQVLDRDRQLAHLVQEQRDADIAAAVEGALERQTLILELQAPGRELGGNLRERRLQMQGELLLAELAHQRRLLLDQDERALVDDPDAVRHFLGFLDVVRGQNDGHAALAQAADEIPHVAPQLDVHAGRRLVEEQDVGLVR